MTEPMRARRRLQQANDAVGARRASSARDACCDVAARTRTIGGSRALTSATRRADGGRALRARHRPGDPSHLGRTQPDRDGRRKRRPRPPGCHPEPGLARLPAQGDRSCDPETAAEAVLIGDTWNGVDYRRMLTELIDPLDRKPTIVGLFDAMPKGDPARLPRPPDDAEEVRWIYFTSGTTNDPKGVLHTDSSLIAGARGHAKRLGLGPADVATMAAAFSHIAGPIYLIGMLLAGYSSVIVERFVASEAVPALARYGVTMFGGGIAFYQLLLEEQRSSPESG